jgi:hypothetical protein
MILLNGEGARAQEERRQSRSRMTVACLVHEKSEAECGSQRFVSKALVTTRHARAAVGPV